MRKLIRMRLRFDDKRGRWTKEIIRGIRIGTKGVIRVIEVCELGSSTICTTMARK